MHPYCDVNTLACTYCVVMHISIHVCMIIGVLYFVAFLFHVGGLVGKVLTMNKLKKRGGFQLTRRCPLCKEDEET